jgi:hypothetical protein
MANAFRDAAEALAARIDAEATSVRSSDESLTRIIREHDSRNLRE